MCKPLEGTTMGSQKKMEIGPQIPKHLVSKISSDSSECSEDVATDNKLKIVPSKETECFVDIYGPALPPGFKQRTTDIVGPCRPQNAQQNNTDRRNSSENEDDEEGETIGPMLPSQNAEDEYLSKCKAEIEFRARIKKDSDDIKEERSKKREEWMTELPPELGKNFGLGPRKFRNKEVNLGDRSVWTDTPSQREHKKNAMQSKSPERYEKSKKDVDMEKYVTEHNKRYRSESLLNIHQKDQKKKKKTDECTERRPFDRETDLGVRQIDAAKRKSIIKQSTHLNSKFAHSKQGPTYL